MNIAIISSFDDAHIPFVAKHFSASTHHLVIDPFGTIVTHPVSYDFRDGNLHVTYGDTPLDAIDSVWFRKPSHLSVHELPVPEEYQAYTRSGLRHHLGPLYRHWKDAFWLSPYEAITAGENKPHQLVAAAGVGFSVPDTLTTNDRHKAQSFVKSHTYCIVKPQATIFPKGRTLMTRKISAKDDIVFDGLFVDPMIFQQYIEPKTELRVTVVGEQVFGAEVTAKTSTFRDWRYGHIDGSFRAKSARLDASLQEKCIKLARLLGLHYGAIDLIVDRSSTPWFLEINPNGQWAFIEESTGQQIGKAVAHLLETGPTRH